MNKTTPPSSEAASDVQRWTAKRKAAVVLELIKGKTTAVETAREHGLTVGEVESRHGGLRPSVTVWPSATGTQLAKPADQQ